MGMLIIQGKPKMIDWNEKTPANPEPHRKHWFGRSAVVTHAVCGRPILKIRAGGLQRTRESSVPPAFLATTKFRVWTRDVLIAIGLAMVIIVFLLPAVKVRRHSMAPVALRQGTPSHQHIVYRFEPIQRGMLWCLVSAGTLGNLLSSASVGLPGEPGGNPPMARPMSTERKKLCPNLTSRRSTKS